MTLTENKNLHKREAMLFPFRWFISLNELPDDEFRKMFMAIGQYAENKTDPSFSGAMAALWKEYQQRIDFDLNSYEVTCLHRREAGMKGADVRWQGKRKDGKNSKCHLWMAKMAEADAEADNKERTLKSSKETAKPFSLTSETSKPIPYTKWTPEQFRSEIDKYPEYSVYADEFFAYWTESTAKGMMFFQTQPKWETLKRLQMWQRKHAKWNPLSSGYSAANPPNQEQQLSPEEQFKQMNGIS